MKTNYLRAAKLFKSFFGRKPRLDEVRRIKGTDDTVMLVGELDGIIYRIDGERQPLIHRFTSTDRPLLFVSSDGRQLYSVRGRYRFTDRGFVG